MWPVVMATLRRQAPFITLPFAALVGKSVSKGIRFKFTYERIYILS